MNHTIRKWTLLALATALLLSCQTISNVPVINNTRTISLYEILGQFAENQGWSQPDGVSTCLDQNYPWVDSGTTCFEPSSPLDEHEGLTINHIDIYGTPACWVTSSASIYKTPNSSAPEAPTSSEYTFTTEEYHNVAVGHYYYHKGDENEAYIRQIYRWYYENLIFMVQEDAYGANCDGYFPNTQAFQFLINLMEQGYVVE